MRARSVGLNSIEGLLPLRGRWLRYFRDSVFLFVAAWWLLRGCYDWDSLVTLLSADPQYIESGYTTYWGFGCGGGMSLGGVTGKTLQFGPWQLTWLAPNYVPSWQEEVVRRSLQILFLGLAIGLVARWLRSPGKELSSSRRHRSVRVKARSANRYR
jgi:hypothetical protein